MNYNTRKHEYNACKQFACIISRKLDTATSIAITFLNHNRHKSFKEYISKELRPCGLNKAHNRQGFVIQESANVGCEKSTNITTL